MGESSLLGSSVRQNALCLGPLWGLDLVSNAWQECEALPKILSTAAAVSWCAQAASEHLCGHSLAAGTELVLMQAMACAWRRAPPGSSYKGEKELEVF